MRPELGHARHPQPRHLAQGLEFLRLGVGAKNVDVFAHRGFKHIVVGQRRVFWQTQLFDSTAFGGTKLHAFFDHEARGGGCNFFGDVIHEPRIVAHLESSAMHIHILGICGTFMGGLAALAREAGHKVTGCDAGVYPPMSDQLRALGIELIEGFGADQMALKPDVYVIGNVVSRARLADGSAKFPLMEAILESGASYTSGPQWLAEHVLQGRHVLAVAGTHGKTTTSSMLAWVLQACGKEPGFLVGGVPMNFGVSARLGQQAPFVIEADEYDTAFFDKRSKFVHYRPRTAILNNLEFDHADIFDDLAAIEAQFRHLVRIIPEQGRIIVPSGDEALERVLARGCWSKVVRTGAADGLRGQAVGANELSDFFGDGLIGSIKWDLTGDHNRANALAALAAARHIGIDLETGIAALSKFQGVKRRMEIRGEVQGIIVYDDFAHHPTAIQTTINGLREQVGCARIIAVLEPRSNTMKLGTTAARLPAALAEADVVFCFAQQTGKHALGWDPHVILESLGDRLHVHSDIETLIHAIAEIAGQGDQILIMSNGGFADVHRRLLETLATKQD